MKCNLLKILILLLILSLSSNYLGSFSRKKETLAAEQSIQTWLIKKLNLKDLVAGYLWLKFDRDSMDQLANYHRLLINLDAITALNPDDFEAWSLKNFMRLDRGIKKDDKEMIARALEDYALAAEINSNNPRFLHDAAQAIFIRLDNKPLALEYAQKCFKLEDHGIETERLLALIYQKMGKIDDSIRIYQNILNNPESEKHERKLAKLKIAALEEKKNNNN
ncbi:MAG: hypothetical protein ACQETH_03680 [Candidatus Rifleibacteriota bacterium]